MNPKLNQGQRANRSGKFLEQVINSVQLLGFNWAPTLDDDLFGGRQYATNVPYTTIFGTKGRHEFVIRDEHANKMVVECKRQNSGGSVDEKICYVYQSFLDSEFRDWWYVYDGAHWESGRGEQVICWLAAQPQPGGRRLRVLTYDKFLRAMNYCYGRTNPRGE